MRMNEKAFVCKQAGCPQAQAGKLFASQGLIAHYRASHTIAEGQRQLDKQRKKAKALDVLDATGDFMQARDAVEPEKFDETGEQLPGESAQSAQQLDRSAGAVDIRQILDEHIGRIESQVTEVKERLDSATFELKSLQDELVRAKAAKSAYAMESQLKSRNDGEYA